MRRLVAICDKLGSIALRARGRNVGLNMIIRQLSALMPGVLEQTDVRMVWRTLIPVSMVQIWFKLTEPR